MQTTLQSAIQNLEQQYHLKCNSVYISQQPKLDFPSLLPALLSSPMKAWTVDSQTVQRIIETNWVQPNTLLEIQTGLNISEPGKVSLCKPNSTVKLFLTDGYNSMKALLVKGCSMDLRDNIGRKILIKAGNTVKYGVLILRNYDILDKAVKMEEEELDQAENQFEGLEGLEDLIL